MRQDSDDKREKAIHHCQRIAVCRIGYEPNKAVHSDVHREEAREELLRPGVGNLGAKWAQKLVFWAQIEEWPASKGSRINVNFAELWSGRWESNKSE